MHATLNNCPVITEIRIILDERADELMQAAAHAGRSDEASDILDALQAAAESDRLSSFGRRLILNRARPIMSAILYPDQPAGAGAGEPTGWEIVPT